MQGPYEALKRPAGAQEFVPLAAAAGLAGFVIVEATATIEETEWLLEIAAADALVRGVVGWLDLTSEDISDQIGAARLVGLRLPARSESEARLLTRPDIRRGLAAVAAADRALDLLVTSSHMPAAIELVDAMPELRFVLDHLGKPPISGGRLESWATDLRRLAASPNVAAKLSGLVTEADWSSWSPDSLKPAVDLALEAFGAQRLMFGSDWPVASLAADYATVIDTAASLIEGLSTDEQELIWHGTAERWYRLVGAA